MPEFDSLILTDERQLTEVGPTPPAQQPLVFNDPNQHTAKLRPLSAPQTLTSLDFISHARNTAQQECQDQSF